MTSSSSVNTSDTKTAVALSYDPYMTQNIAGCPLKVTRQTPRAFLPKRASAGSAGYDLASAEDCTVPARGRLLVSTGLVVKIPGGCYGRVAPRSGLALKHGIDVGAGVIDNDYTGVLGVVLFNHNDAPFEIKWGDRIAQLILEVNMHADVQEENAADLLWFDDGTDVEDERAHRILRKNNMCSENNSFLLTTRGSQGFGSTGS